MSWPSLQILFLLGKQLYPFGISWFDPLDPIIIVVVLRSKTKEVQSWFSKGKQLYPFGISWFDPLDPTIISLWEIMVFQRKTIIVVVCCFTDSNKSSKTKEAQSWLLLFYYVKQKKRNNYLPSGDHGKRLFILFCFLDLFFYNICYKDKKSATLCVAK